MLKYLLSLPIIEFFLINGSINIKYEIILGHIFFVICQVVGML